MCYGMNLQKNIVQCFTQPFLLFVTQNVLTQKDAVNLLGSIEILAMDYSVFVVHASIVQHMGLNFYLIPEDPHNVFRFFMCKKMKLTGQGAVKAGFYDNACNLHQYCLNREPSRFEFLNFLLMGHIGVATRNGRTEVQQEVT